MGQFFCHFLGVRGVKFCDIFAQTCPWEWLRLGKKENLLFHQKLAWNSNFCEPNFQEFRLRWWHKELFLHCGAELIGLGPSWMGLTQGNVILEPSAFQKYSHFSVQLFFYVYFATRPRPSLTAVSWLPKKVIISVNTNQIWIYRQTNKHIDISLPTSSEKWIMCKLWDQRNFRSTLEQKCHFSWSVSVTEMDSQFMICVRI